MRMQGFLSFQVLSRFLQYLPRIAKQSFGDGLMVRQTASVFARQWRHEPDFQFQTEYVCKPANRSEGWGLRSRLVGSDGRL